MKIKEMGGRREAGGAKEPSTFHLKPSTKRSAFTLIEMIGVMALIAILAAVAVPPLISRLETVDSAKEDANLEEIARALAEGIKATGTIPNPALAAGVSGSWTAIAFNYTFLAPRLLATNFPARNARQIILSAGLSNYVATNGFTNPSTGWSPSLPSGDMKIYILASSKRNLPLLSGIPVGDIESWTKVYGNTGTIPVSASVFGATLTNKGEFLHVASVDIKSLFCRVTLVEYPEPTNAATDFSISDGPPATHYGVGYSSSATYLGTTSAGYTFSFTAPTTASPLGSLASASGGTSGTLASGSKTMILRQITTIFDRGTVAGGSTLATFQASVSPTAPYPPWWRISPASTVGGNQMPASANTTSFLVIKGTSLSLYGSGASLPGSPLLTLPIQSDSTFEYFNGSWTRVD